MNNILVATFNDDKTAIDAMHKLYEIDLQGDVEVSNHILLKRRPDGTFEYLKDERDPDGWGTLTGTLVGSLVGLVGGPVGVIAGFVGGMTLGAVTDAFRYGYDYDFMESLKKGLPVGTTLIAEVNEPSPVFVDNAFTPLGAQVYRSGIYTEQEKYFESQVQAMDAEVAEAERQFDAALAEDKAAWQAKLNALRARRDERVAAMKADIEDDIDSFNADIDRLQKKIQSKVDEVKKNRLEHKLAKNQERVKKYQAQAAKLNSELAGYATAA